MARERLANGVYTSTITAGGRLLQLSIYLLLVYFQTTQLRLVTSAITCTDTFECCGRNITANLVNCWGFQSCCYSNELIANPVSVELSIIL